MHLLGAEMNAIVHLPGALNAFHHRVKLLIVMNLTPLGVICMKFTAV